MSVHRLLVIVALLLAFTAPVRATAPIPSFADGDRVLFVGDSITRAGPWHSLIALFYETRFPDRKITWLNAGVSGDTATAALRRLDWDVLERNPNRVVIMFGVNDVSITLYDGDNAPEKVAAREAKFTAYKQSMRQIVDRLLGADKSVILVTPPPYEEHGQFPSDKIPRPGANAAVTRCAEFTRALATEKQLPLVDFNGPMNRMIQEYQKTNPDFTLAADRVHPTPGGYLVMGYYFLKAMNVPDVVATTETAGTHFTYRPKALPVPFDESQRRFLPLVPFENELNREILKVSGLAEGKYEAVMDGMVVGTWWKDELTNGINLATVTSTPSYRRALEIKKIQDQRHGDRSIGPRILVGIRHQLLEPAGINPNDPAAVEAFLKDKTEGKLYKRFTTSAEADARRADQADKAIAALKANLPVVQVVIRPVAAAVPVEKRQAVFDNRHSPAAVSALAADFFPLLTLDPAERRDARLEARPELDNVSVRLAKHDNLGALTVWRDGWMARLANASALGFSSICSPGALKVPDAKRAAVIARADELMKGQVVAEAKPMQPGAVWLAPPRASLNGEPNPWRPGIFDPLAQAYLLTGKASYLECYFAYIDDWAINEECDAQISPTDISDTESKAAGVVGSLLNVLGAVAGQPGGIALVPPDTLARVQLRLVRLYPALGVIYHSSNPQNWTPGGTAGLMGAALAFDDFRFAGRLFDLARARHENYGVIQFFPDGSETENALWYNAHYVNGAMEAISLARALKALPAASRPRWTDPVANDQWIAVQTGKADARARFFAHMIAPPGRYPIGDRIDARPVPQGSERRMIQQAADDGYADAAAILAALPTRAGPGKDPGFTFSALPWRGSFMFRTGWSATDSYAHFFSSPYPAGGHAFLGLKNNNSFGLGVAGRDLIVGGSYGSYSYDRSPLRVDGLEQFFNAGLGNPGINKNHKGFAVAYLDPEPPAWRSYSGKIFAFAEGIYSGPYGEFVDDHHDSKNYLPSFLADRAAAVLTGVSHRRQVFQLKSVGAWIVVDRVSSDHPHDYTLDWRFPIERLVPPANPRHNAKYPYRLPKPEDFKIDTNSGSITLAVPGEPGASLRQFGPTVTTKVTREQGENLVNDYTLGYKLYDHEHVASTWHADPGESVVVTLVMPTRDGMPAPLSAIAPLGDSHSTRGFTAIAADGTPVGFLAAMSPEASLRVGKHTADGEALLVVGDAVLELGAHRAEGPADFVRVAPGAPEIAIYKPIQNIHFEPNRTVLLDGEAVTITCSTAGVEIRYTLDGADPTASSPLYTGPIVVKADTYIKARAFRPRVTTLPPSFASTHVAPVFDANFVVESPVAAAAVDEASLKPGLTAVTRVGAWQDLFFFPERTHIESQSDALTLFSRVSPRADEAFGVSYTGYFDAPADGVYTFQAPLELVTSPQEPGYCLNLVLGQSWYPATTRHAYGTWSVALKKGPHPFHVYYADYRRDAVDRLDHPGLRINTIWQGKVPSLLVSGPGLDRVEIPAALLSHQP